MEARAEAGTNTATVCVNVVNALTDTNEKIIIGAGTVTGSGSDSSIDTGMNIGGQMIQTMVFRLTPVLTLLLLLVMTSHTCTDIYTGSDASMNTSNDMGAGTDIGIGTVTDFDTEPDTDTTDKVDAVEADNAMDTAGTSTDTDFTNTDSGEIRPAKRA